MTNNGGSRAGSSASVGSGVGGSRTFRQLTDVEYKEKRSRGLCFYCHERYTPEHVCKNKQNKQFKFMIIEEE